MSIRSYRPHFDQSRFDQAQIGGDHYREIAERQLIPQIIERQRQALNVVPDFFNFYQRSYAGRRCSCWSGPESTPSSLCIVCFGTGNTGGYQKYGHITEAMDVTASSAAVGVVVDYDQLTRPLAFRLVDCQTNGFVEFNMPVQGGIDQCTLASVHAVVKRGGMVSVGVKTFAEATFAPLSQATVTERLAAGRATGGLVFRVTLSRTSSKVASPRFSLLRIRYATLTEDRLPADVPRSVNSNRTSEFGYFYDTATKSMYLGPTLRSVTSEDLFRHTSTGKFWRVIDANENAPAGWLTSWDVNVRMVQDTDRYAMIPG